MNKINVSQPSKELLIYQLQAELKEKNKEIEILKATNEANQIELTTQNYLIQHLNLVIKRLKIIVDVRQVNSW